MIAVVDYGRGNLGSVERVFARVGVPAVVTQEPRVIDEADAVVFPGDGAFHDSMASLAALGLLAPVRRALDGRRPFLGICIGYQLLFSTSDEFGEGQGLDVIPGVVRRFPGGLDVPHMGWNRVWHGGELRLFEGIPDGAHFYFVHSYFPVVAAGARTGSTEGGLAGGARGSDTPGHRVRQAWCEYGVRFAAAIETGSIYATQFHPEKSGRGAGIRLLENFAAIVKASGARSVR
ncbi:MAG: imidazole glycerol phosphate synthase subunit HisH [Candidatus Rokuibacteriota bacterium]|nr:MAG: imidazole glycerol phosphate synthase subunit HisH [Candidatus Rokubacteria bacterium]